MFFKSKDSVQLDIFSSVGTFLSGRSLKRYEDSKEWHNMFRVQVTMRIDEELFRPLFCENNGASNASIRVLVSMMILKEAHGWSDSELFSECRFNLLIRSALGLFNMQDSVPAESTYYLLRKRIVEWEKSHNENLIEKCFSQVTKLQVVELEVKGEKIRMDSKLLGSNIAWYSRYELIHEGIRKAYSSIEAEMGRLSLSESDIKLLESIVGESGDKVVYRSKQPEIENKMTAIGLLIYKIISKIENHPSEDMQILYRIFEEQYIVNKDEVNPRSKEAIRADSVQSPHDTECHFRNKDGNKIKGYSINVTETCDGADSLNLITDIQVDTASASDCNFLQQAVEDTQEILTQKIKTLNTDGAYNSTENQDYCKENTIDLILGAIQGKPPRYDLLLDENGELIVTDLQTNTILPCRMIKSRKKEELSKWAIKNEEGKNRYFTQKEIDTCLLRKQIGARTPAELNVRNNVEATIFQLGYHYPNDKSRYRGLSKHIIWANVRCLWINFVRIMNFIARNGSNCIQKLKNQLIIPLFFTNFAQRMFIVMSLGNLCRISAMNGYRTRFEKMDFL